MAAHEADLILCGGGLQNALVVAALYAAPGLATGGAPRSVALLERAAIGGNHTWCFYESDLAPAMRRQVEPFISHRWSSYEVRFPGFRRRLRTPYAMIASRRLRATVLKLLTGRNGALAWEQAPVDRVAPGMVRLADGREVRGAAVIDARGADGGGARCGYQKFYGQEVTLREPHGLQWPLVMDATVPQHDGFRFMYVLPLSPYRALVEDTSFSDGPHLDVAQRQRAIAAWLRRHGWRSQAVTRTEQGVLPMPWQMPDPPDRLAGGVVLGGYRGGWFHPGTGYSLPLAGEMATLAATTPPARLPAVAAAARRQLQRRARFCCLLNRLLFHAYPPAARRNVFARFYRLPEPTIRRFFALRLTASDRLRLLGGRPPRGLSLRHWHAAHTGSDTGAAGAGEPQPTPRSTAGAPVP